MDITETEFVGKLIVGLSTLCALVLPLITQTTKLAKSLATTNTLLTEMIKRTEKNADAVHCHDVKLENHEQRIHRLEEDFHDM